MNSTEIWWLNTCTERGRVCVENWPDKTIFTTHMITFFGGAKRHHPSRKSAFAQTLYSKKNLHLSCCYGSSSLAPLGDSLTSTINKDTGFPQSTFSLRAILPQGHFPPGPFCLRAHFAPGHIIPGPFCPRVILPSGTLSLRKFVPNAFGRLLLITH